MQKKPFDTVKCKKCKRKLPYSQTIQEGEYKGWCNECQIEDKEKKRDAKKTL